MGKKDDGVAYNKEVYDLIDKGVFKGFDKGGNIITKNGKILHVNADGENCNNGEYSKREIEGMPKNIPQQVRKISSNITDDVQASVQAIKIKCRAENGYGRYKKIKNGVTVFHCAFCDEEINDVDVFCPHCESSIKIDLSPEDTVSYEKFKKILNSHHIFDEANFYEIHQKDVHFFSPIKKIFFCIYRRDSEMWRHMVKKRGRGKLSHQEFVDYEIFHFARLVQECIFDSTLVHQCASVTNLINYSYSLINDLSCWIDEQGYSEMRCVVLKGMLTEDFARAIAMHEYAILGEENVDAHNLNVFKVLHKHEKFSALYEYIWEQYEPLVTEGIWKTREEINNEHMLDFMKITQHTTTSSENGRNRNESQGCLIAIMLYFFGFPLACYVIAKAFGVV